VNARERLDEIYRRLNAAPRSATERDAYQLLCLTIDEVEDELSGAPNIPANWRHDNRIYPPQPDRLVRCTLADTVCYQTRGHEVFIGSNGAIAIRHLLSQVIELSKPGADGGVVAL
jgi:hypothetical protein